MRSPPLTGASRRRARPLALAWQRAARQRGEETQCAPARSLTWYTSVSTHSCVWMRLLAQRRELHRAPGVAAAARAMFESGEPGADALDLVDLYSCFPVAVESYAAEMGLDLERDLEAWKR